MQDVVAYVGWRGTRGKFNGKGKPRTGCAPTTIEANLAAIRNHMRYEIGVDFPESSKEKGPFLYNIIQGMKRDYNPRVKEPITIDMLSRIGYHLTSTQRYDDWVLWTNMVLLWRGINRANEQIQPEVHGLRMGQFFWNGKQTLSLDKILKAEYMDFVVTRSKKDYSGAVRSCTVICDCPSPCALCATKALVAWRSRTAPPRASSKIFKLERTGKPLSYNGLYRMIKEILHELGYNEEDYATHSFRRGGLQFSMREAIPVEALLAMGWWKHINSIRSYTEKELEKIHKKKGLIRRNGKYTFKTLRDNDP